MRDTTHMRDTLSHIYTPKSNHSSLISMNDVTTTSREHYCRVLILISSTSKGALTDNNDNNYRSSQHFVTGSGFQFQTFQHIKSVPIFKFTSGGTTYMPR